jgi:ATP-binding cassette subfamily B protein
MPRPDLPGLPPQSIRERVGALRNLRPFLKLIWQTSPTITVTVIALRIVRALLPVATLYVGALIIDAVVKLAQSPPAGATLEQWMASGKLDPLVTLLLLEFGLAVLSDVLGRVVALLDSLLSERFNIATSLRLMAHAASLDLEDFEDSEVQDRLERARQQASGRTGS